MYISITQDTGLCTDDGSLRTYELIASGSSPDELADNAYIVEIDEYGCDQDCKDLNEYDERVYQRCMVIIAKAWLEAELEEVA